MRITIDDIGLCIESKNGDYEIYYQSNNFAFKDTIEKILTKSQLDRFYSNDTSRDFTLSKNNSKVFIEICNSL